MEKLIQPNVLKSKNDKRDTYTYKLENKLRVFIINDSDTDIACAGMMVKIGYFQDTVPGIAHFLEHMLFCGTKNYPDEKLFSTFVSKNNGSQNAYTAHDHTCYYFSISQEGLNEGLKIFGDFFISPLLKKDCIQREKEAVNSEHKKNINDDMWRRQELIRAVTNDEHWFSNFGTGSNETLDIPDIDLKVKEFFNKYYSSDLMSLVVITNDKIENTKKIIDEVFSNIKIKKINNNDLVIDRKIFNTPSTIKYIPIENEQRLTLIWEVPFFKNIPTQSPLEFLGDLIGNEKKNSIHYIFTKKDYIYDVSCYVREIIFTNCLFCIDFKLTPIGEKNKREIIFTVMNYIEKIKNNLSTKLFEQLYNERLKLFKYKFDHFEKSGCIDTVIQLNTILNTYDIEPEKVFIIDSMQEKYSNNIKDNLKKILEKMTLENLVIIIGSKKYEKNKYKKDIKKFPHYGTEYITKNSIYNITDINFDNNIEFPQPNLFISISNKIFNLKNSNPILLKNETSKSFETFWMPNTEFNTPDICIFLSINVQMALKNIYTDTSMILYLLTILKELNHINYEFQSALYSFSISYSHGKINIKLRGNYENIENVLETYLKNLIEPKIISNEMFNSAKNELTKEDENDIYKAPREKVDDLFQKFIFKGNYDSEDRLKIINEFNKEHIMKVFHRILPYNNIILFISGNCTEEKAYNIQKITSMIPQKYHDYNNYKFELYKIPNKTEIHNFINKNLNEENNSTGFYLYIDTLDFSKNTQWVKNLCLLNLLHNIISNEYFDQLRTKEMYGYIVKSRIVNLGEPSLNNFYYMFLVQSPNKTNENITERTEKFIIEFYKILKKMSEDDIETLKNGFITGLISNFNNLYELSSYVYNNEIVTEYLKYDSRQVMADECKKITLKDLTNFYNEKFINNNKRIVIQVSKQK